jgi:DNA-binding response OmpR family regulator
LKPSAQPKILMIGNDPALSYLLGRYAARSGYELDARTEIPQAGEVSGLKPAALLFLSVENLEASQALVAGLTNSDIPVLVCTSISEEARVRDLGADYCLIHPVTYDSFHSALAVQLPKK